MTHRRDYVHYLNEFLLIKLLLLSSSSSPSFHVLLRPLMSIRISSQHLNLLRTPYTSNHHQQYFNIFYCEIPFCLPIMMKKKTIFVKYFPKLYDAISSLGLCCWKFGSLWAFIILFALSLSLAVLRCLCSILLCKLLVYDDISLLILTFSFSANFFSLLFDFFLSSLIRPHFYALDHTQILLKFYGLLLAKLMLVF